MKSKLHNLNLLIDKLALRVNTAIDNNNISTLETDIILDLLRQAYMATEQIRMDIPNSIINTSSELPKNLSVVSEDDKSELLKIGQSEDDSLIKESEIEHMQVQADVSPIERTIVDEVPQMSFSRVEVEVNDIADESAASEQKPEVAEVYNVSSHDTAAANTVSIVDKPMTPNSLEEDNKLINQTSGKNKAVSADLFGTPTLADKLKSEIPTVIDKINQGKSDQTLAHKMQLKPIDDLRNAIGINEKFQFVNDLFEGRIELYNDAINRLNSCGSMNNADSVFSSLKSTLGWNENNEAFNKLKSFINRRYL